jgi:hypothetical protein
MNAKTNIETEHYRYKRYQIPYSIVMCYSNCQTAHELLKSKLRKTDIVLGTNEGYSGFLLSHTELNGASKFVQNFTCELEQSNYFAILQAGVCSSDCTDTLSGDVVLKQAFQRLDYAMRFNKNSICIDSNDLME